MKCLDVLKNETGSTVRFAFKADLPSDDYYVVVKLFIKNGAGQPAWSVKYWRGNYEVTKSHWRTQTPVSRTESMDYRIAALTVLSAQQAMLSAFHPIEKSVDARVSEGWRRNSDGSFNSSGLR